MAINVMFQAVQGMWSAGMGWCLYSERHGKQMTFSNKLTRATKAEVLNSSPRAPPPPPRSAYFACLSLLTHLIQIISLLEVRSVHELCSDWHAPYTGSIAPYTVSIAPYTGSIALYTVSIAPYTGSIALYTGSIAPYTGSIAPYTGSIAPYTGSIAPYTGSIAPYSLSRGNPLKFTLFRDHSFMDLRCATSSRTDECDIIYLCKYRQF